MPKIMKKNQSINNFNDSTSESMARNSSSESGKMVLRRAKKHPSSNAYTLKRNRASTSRNGDPEVIQMMELFLTNEKQNEKRETEMMKVHARAFLKTHLKSIEELYQHTDASKLRERFEKEMNPMIGKMMKKSADMKQQAKQLSEVISKNVEDRKKMIISHEENVAKLREQIELHQKVPSKKQNASPEALDQHLKALQTALMQNAKQRFQS